MDKVKTQVTVGRQTYSIVTEDPSHIKRVGIYTDKKFQEINEATKLPSLSVAVLTALNIADELFNAQNEITRLRKEILRLSEKAAAPARPKKEKQP